jgi:hypothetical protein
LCLLLPPLLLLVLLPSKPQADTHATLHTLDADLYILWLLLLLPGQPQGSHPAHVQALLRADGAAAAEAEHTRHKRPRQAAQGEHC